MKTLPMFLQQKEAGKRQSESKIILPAAGSQCCTATSTKDFKETQLFITECILKWLCPSFSNSGIRFRQAIGYSRAPSEGSTITTFGARFISLHFGLHVFQARLVTAGVKYPLLGTDFVRQHNPLVDIRNHYLIVAEICFSIPCSISSVSRYLAFVEPAPNKFLKVLNDYTDLLKPIFSTAVVKRGVQHFIHTKDRPFLLLHVVWPLTNCK